MNCQLSYDTIIRRAWLNNRPVSSQSVFDFDSDWHDLQHMTHSSNCFSTTVDHSSCHNNSLHQFPPTPEGYYKTDLPITVTWAVCDLSKGESDVFLVRGLSVSSALACLATHTRAVIGGGRVTWSISWLPIGWGGQTPITPDRDDESCGSWRLLLPMWLLPGDFQMTRAWRLVMKHLYIYGSGLGKHYKTTQP